MRYYVPKNSTRIYTDSHGFVTSNFFAVLICVNLRHQLSAISGFILMLESTFFVTTIGAALIFANIANDSSSSQNQPPTKYTEIVTTEDGQKISFEMVLIPPALSCESKSGGSFLMGSPAGEAGRKDDEGPQHQVRLEPFYLCTTETTLELFLAYYQQTVTAKKDFIETEQAKKSAELESTDVDAITGPTPVYGDLTMGYTKKHPAIGMTWHNAMTFCRWLSKKTGKEYRLPTEAEWEYACRAGTASVFGSAPADQLIDFTWYKANSDSETHEVAKKKPNAWGLYDMLGNVREWVYDFYSPTGYAEDANPAPIEGGAGRPPSSKTDSTGSGNWCGAAVNPKGPETGQVHVARGGDYDSDAKELRCAARAFEEKWWRSGDPQIPKSKWWLPEMDFIGFRVARTIDK